MSLRRHTAYNLAGTVLPVIGMLITLPIYLQTIGEERYGILIVVWTLVGYFGLFDFGLGRAVTNRLAALSEVELTQRHEIFWTALLTSSLLGIIGASVLWITADTIFRIIVDVPGTHIEEIGASLPALAVSFPLLLASSVLTGALLGREEFLAKNLVAVAIGLLVQVAPLVVALHLGPSLTALIVSVVFVRIVGNVALFVLCIGRLKLSLRPRLALHQARSLFSFGGWVTVTSTVGPLLTTLDRLLIGGVAGVRAVTYYTVPFSLTSRLLLLSGSLSEALFPKFSSLGRSERDALLSTAVDTLSTIMTPLAVALLLMMEPFLAWWVGPEFATKASLVGEILVLGVWANSLAFIPFSQIQGRGRPDLTGKFHLAELIPYLAVLWLAVRWYGPVGAAMAWTIRVWVDAALMFRASLRSIPVVTIKASGMLAIAAVAVFLTSGQTWPAALIRIAITGSSLYWAWLIAPISLKEWVSKRVRVPSKSVTAGT